MKLSKKTIAKFQAKEMRVREGHFANNVEGMVKTARLASGTTHKKLSTS